MVYLQRCVVVTWLVPHETGAVSARSVYTIQPCHVTSCKAICIRRVHACSAVTYLHFWQNDQDIARATAVARGWNGYRKKESAQKKILPPLLPGLEPVTF